MLYRASVDELQKCSIRTWAAYTFFGVSSSQICRRMLFERFLGDEDYRFRGDSGGSDESRRISPRLFISSFVARSTGPPVPFHHLMVNLLASTIHLSTDDYMNHPPLSSFQTCFSTSNSTPLQHQVNIIPSTLQHSSNLFCSTSNSKHNSTYFNRFFLPRLHSTSTVNYFTYLNIVANHAY